MYDTLVPGIVRGGLEKDVTTKGWLGHHEIGDLSQSRFAFNFKGSYENRSMHSHYATSEHNLREKLRHSFAPIMLEHNRPPSQLFHHTFSTSSKQ